MHSGGFIVPEIAASDGGEAVDMSNQRS